MSIFVKIIDNDRGTAIYKLTYQVQVTKNIQILNETLNSILPGATNSYINNILNSGDTKIVLSTINSIVSMLNSESYADQNGVKSNCIFDF
jgi:hypothetical protein